MCPGHDAENPIIEINLKMDYKIKFIKITFIFKKRYLIYVENKTTFSTSNLNEI